MTFEIKIQTLVMLGSGETHLVQLCGLQINMFVTYESQKKKLWV